MDRRPPALSKQDEAFVAAVRAELELAELGPWWWQAAGRFDAGP